MCVCVYELPARNHKYAIALHIYPFITKPLNLRPTPSFPAWERVTTYFLSPFPKAVYMLKYYLSLQIYLG